MTTQIRTHTGPELVSLTDAKAYLKVDWDTEDTLIEGLVEAARSHAESYTNLIIRPATVEVTFDEFLPWYYLNGPVTTITSITLTDRKGVNTVLPIEDYHCNRSALPARLYVTHEPAGEVAYVTVQYTAGYDTDPILPTAIRNAILHLVAEWYENREDGARRFPTVSRRLLDLERRQFIA